jgi:hypothetical protein
MYSIQHFSTCYLFHELTTYISANVMTLGPIASNLYIGARSSFPFPSASPLRVRYSPTQMVENGVLIPGSLCCSLTLFLELEMFNLRVGSTVHKYPNYIFSVLCNNTRATLNYSTTPKSLSCAPIPIRAFPRPVPPVSTKSKSKSKIILKYNPKLTYKSVLSPVSYI